MTAFERFDPFEQRVSDALVDIAAPRRPDYLDDILRQTARTAQRPRWSFPGRWLPMVDILPRRAVVGRSESRVLLLALLLVLLLAAVVAIAVVGARRPVLLTFGPAGNGVIVSSTNGDLYVRDSLDAPARLLIGGDGEQSGALFSQDGRLVAYDSIKNGVDTVMVAHVDGSNPVSILGVPFVNGWAAWLPDSERIALTSEDHGTRRLWLANADGSGATMVDLGNLEPWSIAVRPGTTQIVFQGENEHGVNDLYLLDLAGGKPVPLHRTDTGVFGPEWQLSGVAFSPDGTTISYNALTPVNGSARFTTHLVSVDGTRDRAVVTGRESEATFSVAWATWSPDSKWIVMESFTDIGSSDRINQLYLAPADGSAPAHAIGPALADQSLLRSWSPDGTKILLTSRDRNQVYLIDPVSEQWQLLPWTSDMPDWQRVAR